ncbi:MAG: hypothetical protein Q8Q60_01315 [Candidatus Chromulinivorax sp.]|nr:hypothetical protein [Candidatus Chromulinivorax sp.]
MKLFQTKKLIVALLLLLVPFVSFAKDTTNTSSSWFSFFVPKKPVDKKIIQADLSACHDTSASVDVSAKALAQKDESTPDKQALSDKIDVKSDFAKAPTDKNIKLTGPVITENNLGPAPVKQSKESVKCTGKIVKEVYASKYMTYLNHTNVYDAAAYDRTTADGILVAKYGDNSKNPSVEAKLAIRARYIAGSEALIKTASSTITLGGATVTTPSVSIQKSLFWLRELFVKISLDANASESLHYLKFGSFPYDLGRGIALGSAYNSGGFLGLNPRFSIDQFAPGGLLHTDIIKDSLSGDLYYAVLSNPNLSFKDNVEVIRANEITEITSNNYRGLNRQAWVTAAALHWKALSLKDLKLNVDPYAYMYISPDQNLEFAADSDSQLYAIGTALEFKAGRFEWGVDTAFQGGRTNVKAWDRNYTTLVNNDGTISVQYTKVYTDDTYTTLAIATTANQAYVAASELAFSENGQEIGTSGLWNATDRFRPAQKFFYHGYFFVTDMSVELIENQLKFCADTGFVSGHLDEFNDIDSLTTAQLEHQNFGGFIPVQSVYSGKRIQHLVMLNTGVPRFTVQDPTVPLADQHVPSRVMGVATLTDKFTNLAYTGIGFECTPAKFAEQKAMIKPVALYYWMAQAPTLSDGSTASHALGTALSVEFMATVKECLDMGGYVGWMIPGKQYQQFAGLKLKGGILGSDTAYVLNFTMTYKF